MYAKLHERLPLIRIAQPRHNAHSFAVGVRWRIVSPGSVDTPCAAALTCCLCNLCELILEKGLAVLNWVLLCRRATCGLKISFVMLAMPSRYLTSRLWLG